RKDIQNKGRRTRHPRKAPRLDSVRCLVGKGRTAQKRIVLSSRYLDAPKIQLASMACESQIYYHIWERSRGDGLKVPKQVRLASSRGRVSDFSADSTRRIMSCRRHKLACNRSQTLGWVRHNN